MSPSRRQTLRILGGGTGAAIAAATGFVATRTPAEALAPWDNAGTQEDPRLHALSYAILAPNPHNRQPWMVELVEEDTVILHRDSERNLPETDPFDRQIFIGLGCFLEQMTVAATMNKLSVTHELFPEGETGPVAISTFAKGTETDPLSQQILARRSCKEPFSPEAVSQEDADALNAYATLVQGDEEVARLRQLTIDAWRVEAMTHRTMRESVDLMRFGKAEINANPDGIDMGGAFLEAMHMAGIVTPETLLDPASTGFKEGQKSYEAMLNATPAYAVLTSPTNTREDQIDAGRRWLRLNLATTGRAMSLHPVSQALQEFPEMAEHYQAAHTLLAEPGHTVQMLGRLGYGPSVPPTPRWSLETRLRNV